MKVAHEQITVFQNRFDIFSSPSAFDRRILSKEQFQKLITAWLRHACSDSVSRKSEATHRETLSLNQCKAVLARCVELSCFDEPVMPSCCDLGGRSALSANCIACLVREGAGIG
jgi:hypothetical protein